MVAMEPIRKMLSSSMACWGCNPAEEGGLRAGLGNCDGGGQKMREQAGKGGE